ncbi:MAG: phospholipid carrier-dependent glycosyltransferase [Bacteroidota bacterium]
MWPRLHISFSPRFLFFALCLLPFILIPVLSLNSGISGDEPVHYAHAEKVVKYFQSDGKDTAALNTPVTNLKYYGQSFDNLSYRINQLIKPANPYRVRHLLNSLAGALTILFAALLAFEIAGYSAGILTILFLILSPVFLGQSFNNLKDIPFALGYVMSIYFLVRFMRHLPRIRLRYLVGIAAGAGLAFSIRAGALFLLPVIILFVTAQAWLTQPRRKKVRLRFWLVLSFMIIFTLSLTWFIGLTDWPWARLDPIGNPIRSLTLMTKYTVSIRQLFDGSLIWSESLPWFYAPKYLLITTPVIILAGFLLACIFPRPFTFSFLLLPFSFLFPLLWVLFRDSNLYGGIRHLLFIYPVLALLAAVGWSNVFSRIKKRSAKWILILAVSGGLILPLVHIIRNHPVEYVYFNELSGGMKNAYGRYETDYYFHSLGPAFKWLDQKILSKPGSDTLKIASNFPLDPYLQYNHPDITAVYTTWYERGCYDWDYGLFVNAYLSPSQLKDGRWPPPGSVHTILVNGYPVCIVMKRDNRMDYNGYRAFRNDSLDLAKDNFYHLLEQDPSNETALLFLGWTLRKSGDYSGSNATAEKLLLIHPESEPARELMIWNYLDEKQFKQALEQASDLYRINPKYPSAKQLLTAAQDSAITGKIK